MIDVKTETLLAVAEEKNFTRAAEKLTLTQPAVSHHIRLLEKELGVRLFIRAKGEIRLTPEGETAVRYARRMTALEARMKNELADEKKKATRLRVGITHTSESNRITEVLAQYAAEHPQVSITVLTDTIKNLYDMVENYEIDIAVVEGKRQNADLNYLMLDTDSLVCVLANTNPLAAHSMVTLSELKREQMILRLPSSATRQLFEATLTSLNESIDDFLVTLEVDNISTIKDLIRKELGISILPKSACMDELRKGKLTALPIENLSMIRETNLVYNRDFDHVDVLRELIRLYGA